MIFFIVVIYFIWITFEGYLPKSEIRLNMSNDEYMVDLGIDKDKICRKFNVLDDNMKDEIDEIFTYPYICWDKNLSYCPNISFFKNFKCVYYKKIPKRRIEPFTLIYFPKNGITCLDNVYLHDSLDDKYFFPEYNSILYHDKELIWNGDMEYNIIFGVFYD